ncbi:hypothetical protein ACVWZW_005253 [Bradyrhizobium sp. F1.13.4]
MVAFCSATAPLTVSNTGRMASIACEMRCTASAEPAASRCSASIFLVISSVAPWVCTASALTSVATTAKPLPAAPARAASMVELSASSVVCRAICAIRLTTLPMAAEDSRKRSTLARASCAAALASSASLPASRTCAPMPSADWVNLSAAWAKVEAFDCAALVRTGQGVGAVANGGKRRGGGLGAAGHRIGGALELANHGAQLEFQQFQNFLGRIAFDGRRGLGMGHRLRSLRGSRSCSHVRQTLPK